MRFDMSKAMVVACLLLFAGLIWWQDTAFIDESRGIPRVVDGDSLEFKNERVRLKGIDAPEGRQYCEKQGKKWACGRASTNALRQLIGRQSVVCKGQDYDQHGRLLAFCHVGEVEINRYMVQNGWAVSFGNEFLGQQRQARQAKRGIWQGPFEMPREWRRRNFN